jgi:hypothetical protein
MQPSKTGLPPNARLNPDMQFFNAAIHTLGDMIEHRDGHVCFNLYYVQQADYVKREADRLGISRVTYYNRIKSFARKAYSMSVSLKTAYLAGAMEALEGEDGKCKGNALHNSQ